MKLSALLLVVLGLLLARPPALAQTKRSPIYDTREHILEGARREGRLVVSPGFEESTTPHLIEAFKRKYPFVREVTWFKPPDFRKQALELRDGKIAVDAFRPAPDVWEDYFKHDLLRPYDFRRMATAGHLAIPEPMIDASGMVVWSGSLMGIIVYNANRVGAGAPPDGWNSCLDPQWSGQFAADTKPNVLAALAPRWGEEKVLDYARKLKNNRPIWLRGSSQGLAKLAAGEFTFMCGVYLHATERFLKKNPALPLKKAVPDPLPVAFHEPEAVYARAQNPHVALLWIEFLASAHGQQVLDGVDPGRASFLVEETLAHHLAQGATLSVCGTGCRDRQDNLMKRIAVDAWALPQ
ncbi:MAG TPA: ABC transporter substrate-binding protein [Candidatus Acidoferrales bacterium]|nr:ABC transporter substrate-binding protein [Candidatus Acidoferrales bacterium]